VTARATVRTAIANGRTSSFLARNAEYDIPTTHHRATALIPAHAIVAIHQGSQPNGTMMAAHKGG
jgi:hypothetical protein